jgi:hypothetical protein
LRSNEKALLRIIVLTRVVDAEKGKYFRVQANHVAPQGAKYSHENVKKEREISRVSFVSLFSRFLRLRDLGRW